MPRFCLAAAVLLLAMREAAGHALRPPQRKWARARRAPQLPGARTVGMTAEQAGGAGGAANGTELARMLQRELAKRPRLWGLRHKADKAEGERSGHADGRDELPYRLTSIGPPEKRLGTFRLDPLTHCGDTLCVGDRKFVVKRVTFCYKLSGGKYRMVRKAAACKEQARISAEVALQRMYDADSVSGIDDLDD
ncbi:hypothetical protein KFE25_013325 [Diacronema lutheri]|uniref:Uncharacterized protein n=2 Tax=Diacronema lutheri TaxID=2081491 RepID=A0A8J5XTR4_DIALT|nr:hypothetical protein KFE25_013325 [Diacronema lutheri]